MKGSDELTQLRLRPTNDLLFKKVFATPESRHLLKHLLCDLLGLAIDDLTIQNPYAIEHFYNKQGETALLNTVVDVVVQLANQSRVTVEVQLQRKAYFKERALYYMTEAYRANYGNEQLQNTAHSKYSALTPVYGVNIIDYVMFTQKEQALHQFRLIDQATLEPFNNEAEQSLLNLAFFELKKPARNETLLEWQHYFKEGTARETAPAYIKEAVERSAYYNLNKEERQMVDAIEKQREDLKAELMYAEHKGMRKGIEQGKQEGDYQSRIRTAKKMLQKQYTLAEIEELTGIEIEEI